MEIFSERRAFVLLLVFSLASAAFAHSHLANPLPTRQLHCRVGAQEGRDCYGPCPTADTYGRMNHPWINQNSPAETWARGQLATVRWHRDNHDGTGFVRLALVPVSKMMDKEAHNRYAFQFLCMNSGLHRCPNRSYDVCGNDAKGLAWQAQVRIPTSYPDGIYVFGWSWYGGGDYRKKSYFGDYYSCSFVSIRGGALVTEEYAPVHNGHACMSATDRLGICQVEPCHFGDIRSMTPAEFRNGAPPSIRRKALEEDGIWQADTNASTSKETVAVVDGTAQVASGLLRVFLLDFRDWSKTSVLDGARYHAKDFPSGLTVEAFYDADVRFVSFFVDGVVVGRERARPFVMNGNHGSKFFPWKVPLGRMVKLQVVVHADDGRVETFEADVQFD